MVTLPWAGGATEYQERFDEEARRWKEAGQDFVILHMDAYDRQYPAQLRAYYDACAKVGIGASASWAWFDRNSATGDQAAQWLPQIVRDTKDHPAQWKIDGVPVYSAFNLPSYTRQVLQDAGLWPVKIWAHTYYYMAGVGQLHWTTDANVIRNTYDVLPWLDGLCNFAGDMSTSQITSLNELLTSVGNERGKLTMAGVNPFYGSHHLWDNHFSGLDTQWKGILKNKPNAVWWVTSNDWRELSYMTDLPEAPVWTNHWNRSEMPPLLDHSKYRRFAEPYLAAYKAGQTSPTFTLDRIFLAYQLHPKNATPVAGSPEGIYGGRLWRSSLPDRIFASAHLTAPARLRINGTLSQEFPAGAAHFSIPLTVGDAPEVAIVRNGSVTKSGSGPLPITNSVLIGAWNYLAVEVAAGTGSSPGSPTTGSPSSTTTTTGAFTSADIGSPALSGSSSVDNGNYTVKAAGNDIWDNSDQFHFLSQQINGDTDLVVRVASLAQTDAWAKAGLMLRTSTSASAPHVSVFVTSANGVRMQWRASDAGPSASSGGTAEAAPRWLRLKRAGNTFTAYSSDNGTSWTQVHSVTLALAQTLQGGLAVTSHNSGSLTTATLTNFSVDIVPASSTPTGGGNTTPTTPTGSATAGSLTSTDVGSPAIGGSTSLSNGTFTIKAAGSDIWGSSDQFRFASQQVNGNAELVVRISSLAQTDTWAKAGLMLRASTSSVSAHVSILATPGNGVRMQWRGTNSGQSESSSANGQTIPRWLKLTRSGNAFTAYASTDGSSWSQIHSVSISLPQSLHGGLAVTSHNTSSLTTAVLTNFSVNGTTVSANTTEAPIAGNSTTTTTPTTNTTSNTTTTPTTPTTSTSGSLSSDDIGSPPVGGSTSLSGGTYTITASGSDIWGNSDQFRFISQQITGDTELVVRVAALTQTDVWAKARLMLRASSDASAAHVSVFATPGNGVRMQWRNSAWSESQSSGGISQAIPRWLKLKRSGNAFTAFSSSDGSSWSQVHTVSISLPQTLLGGIAVTSHNTSSLTTAVLTNFSVNGTSVSGNTTEAPVASNSPTPSAPPPTTTTTSTSGSLSSADIGSPSVGGSTSLSGGTYTINASGSDIWGNSDQFRFLSQQITGDTELVVRVAALTQTDVWAKAGLMLRASSDASAAHVSVFATSGNGVRIQWRNNA
ncbi:MAG TPA: endo-1,3-alpha-glucanase family glycosylhydrolase [Opitutaceae bacterium]